MSGIGRTLTPGVARGTRNAAMLPVGPAARPLGDAPVYEFDADRASGKIFLFATTEKGFVAAVVADGELVWTVAPEVPVDGPLTSPSVLVTSRTVHVAALEEDAARFRIVLGHF